MTKATKLVNNLLPKITPKINESNKYPLFEVVLTKTEFLIEK